MLVCSLLGTNRTRDRGCSAHPVFPAPSIEEGGKFPANLGRDAPRDRETISASSRTSEARSQMRNCASGDPYAAAHRLRAQALKTFCTTTAAAYGSRPSPGRRGYSFAFSRRISPEVFNFVSPSSSQRAQGMPDARCTRGLVCRCTRECAHEHTGEAENIRHSLRKGK